MQGQNLRVAVLMGGPSTEHEISIKTGSMVLQNLDPNKFTSQAVIIDKQGKWPVLTQPDDLKKFFDIAFIAMHGEYGEDGTIQQILENAGMPYTGSGVEASKLGMDKEKSLRIFEKELRVPKFCAVEKDEKVPQISANGGPVIVKPSTGGSSIGIEIVYGYPYNLPVLSRAVRNACRYSPKAIVQEFIWGTEFTCGVIERNGKAEALIPTEIIPMASHLFDYKSKYTKGGSIETTPPDEKYEKRIPEMRLVAERAHALIGARGFSRTDMIMDAKTEMIYVLEINTIPGLTETSLFPQGAKATGISFPEMLEMIIDAGLKR